MLFITQKISIGCINKNSFDVMLFDIMSIRFLYTEQILIGNILFVRSITFFNICLELGNRSMQIDQDVGFYQLLMNDVKQALIQTKLVSGQSNFCKQKTFGKKIVTDSNILEKVF